jgi:hypothetical protein
MHSATTTNTQMKNRKSTEGVPWWLLNLIELAMAGAVIGMFLLIIWGLAR